MEFLNIPTAIVKGDGRGHDGLDSDRIKAYQAAMQGKVKNILSVGKDAKTVKGEKYGIRTGIVYLAPANVSGFEMCPKRTPGCSAVCLFTAGQGRFPNVRQGRLRRTYQFLLRQDEYFQALVHEIRQASISAVKDGKKLAIRLNGTSDIRYEDIPVTLEDGSVFPNIFAIFPDVQFYDYTKIVDRAEAVGKIPNYHLTFSRAETKANALDVQRALAAGINVTVVFRKELPAVWNGFPVIDGDRHDVRFWDTMKNGNQPVVIGLLAKGKGKDDDSGFVVDVDEGDDELVTAFFTWARSQAS